MTSNGNRATVVLATYDERENVQRLLPELLELVIKEGFSITEVPIVYEDRQLGRSKMDRRVVIEAAWRPWLLLLRRVGAFLRRRR